MDLVNFTSKLVSCFSPKIGEINFDELANVHYNASKAFESNYMEGLRQKIVSLRLPITVTDIKPGFVKTDMLKAKSAFWASTADKAARQIYSAIERKKSIAYITRRWRLIAWLMKILPARVYERL